MEKISKKGRILQRVMMPVYEALYIIFNSKPLFSKTLEFRMRILHWQIDSLRLEVRRVKKLVEKEDA